MYPCVLYWSISQHFFPIVYPSIVILGCIKLCLSQCVSKCVCVCVCTLCVSNSFYLLCILELDLFQCVPLQLNVSQCSIAVFQFKCFCTSVSRLGCILVYVHIVVFPQYCTVVFQSQCFDGSLFILVLYYSVSMPVFLYFWFLC